MSETKTPQLSPDQILKYFKWEHLPPHLREPSQKIGELAHWVKDNLPPGPERTTCLRKLLEAKDCAVRTLVE